MNILRLAQVFSIGLKSGLYGGKKITRQQAAFQYTSTAYNTLTKEYNILPSMSRAGNPLDNSPAENFFSILKTECINPHKPVDILDAKIMIDEYINFYNFERIQLKTKLTPFESRCQFFTILCF